MGHTSIRRIIDSNNQTYAGRKWFYNFRELTEFCSEDKLQAWCQKKNKYISSLTKEWSDEKHTEWLIRNMLSARMIMGATLHLNSLEHAREKNLRVVTPYLEYYSVLHVMRALIFSKPTQDWKDKALITLSHKKIITLACEAITELNPEQGKIFKETILRLKANRELISYQAPSSGQKWPDTSLNLIRVCTIFCEITQVYSELLEASLIKKYKEVMNYNLNIKDFSVLYNPKIDGCVFPDNEDFYRIEYMLRKNPRPTNIKHTISEGHSEDFFGAWHDKELEKNDSLFNPDKNWQLIFDIP